MSVTGLEIRHIPWTLGKSGLENTSAAAGKNLSLGRVAIMKLPASENAMSVP